MPVLTQRLEVARATAQPHTPALTCYHDVDFGCDAIAAAAAAAAVSKEQVDVTHHTVCEWSATTQSANIYALIHY